MKRLLLIVALLLSSSGLLAHSRLLDVMTYNIRCGSCEARDDINHWSRRKFLVAKVIARHRPDLIGLQEAELFQVRDLDALLRDYDWVGVGRDDGQEKGETTAVLYRRSRFERLTQQTLWLSATPEQVGKGWDAALPRTVTVLRLRDRNSGREFFLFNTHFDHIGQQARIESSKLIVRLETTLAGTLPVIVTGDLNSTKSTEAYTIMAGSLRDAERVSRRRARGGDISFNGFGKDIEPGNKIDFIFVNGGFDVLSHRIVTKTYRGRYPSDHYPVQARLRIADQP